MSGITIKDNGWYFVDLNPTHYQTAQDLQHKLVAARIQKRLKHNVVLWLEHPPVYTLGRRGNRENLRLTEDQLKAKGIPVVLAERGGDVTYHGPGQLIAYPIIGLDGIQLDIPELVGRLEQVMIDTARDFKVEADRNPRNHGIWTHNRKLGSIGLALRQGVSYHGLALNVNLDLRPFEWINPCGLDDVRMTSLREEVGHALPFSRVRKTCQANWATIFGCRPAEVTLDKLDTLDDFII